MSVAGTIVVTGAGGFIGRALVRRLVASGARVVVQLRRAAPLPAAAITGLIGDITAQTDWSAVLRGARVVVHLASRAHRPAGDEREWLEGEATAAANLARAARTAGVERLLLMSSIKVLGERTPELPFRAHLRPAPEDAYGLAKWRMEETVRAALADGPALVVLRPPLVYGPGVKANFLSLIRLVDYGVPLPLASVDNRRAFIFLGNLLDLVVTALNHPAAAGGTFLLRDAEEVSTPALIRAIATALGREPRLFPCPPALLHAAAQLVGRSALADRLLESLRIDDSVTRDKLGWTPRVSLAEGLAETCHWYRGEAGE
jgi:UDP-N-acetyl-alpha-D-quinovosamine dehydrogenase